MIDLPDRFCSISSIMPQKKNPVALEHIRGAAAETMGGLITAFGAETGPTGLAIFPRYHYVLPALDKAFDLILRDIGWLGAIVSGLKANREAMEARAGSLWATAADLAGALVRYRDLPWRTSHQIVGILVRLCIERGIKPDAVTTALLDEAAVEYMDMPLDLGTEVIRKALDPRESVRRRTLYGGTAARETQRRIAAFREKLDEDRTCVADLQSRLTGAALRLEEAIDAILTGKGPAGR
jgi:argininosuccinate lyase